MVTLIGCSLSVPRTSIACPDAFEQSAPVESTKKTLWTDISPLVSDPMHNHEPGCQQQGYADLTSEHQLRLDAEAGKHNSLSTKD